MKPLFLQDAQECYRHDVPEGHRRIAWNGVSFCVPSNWELAVYKFLRRAASRIELEDEYSIRLEAEWIKGAGDLHLKRIMKRYEKASKPLTLKSEERHDVGDLPEGWHATRFVFKETGAGEEGGDLHLAQHELVTAFYLCPSSSLFGFFLIHRLPEDREDPIEILRGIADTFQNHDEDSTGVTPWELFDIGFKVPREFALERTNFDIGAKLMVFGWKRRRLFLWFFSCADVFLKESGSPETWVAGYLNGFSGIRGPVFYPGEEGALTWKRRKPYLFGHREEIARLCYQYEVGCRLLEAENRLVAWAYHYRSGTDLAMLEAE